MNIEMKEHAVSPVLLNHKAGALVSLIETVTMLQICVCSTFWTQHKSYAKSRFSIIRAFEKTSMLQAAIEQYEECYPEREVKVMKGTQWYIGYIVCRPLLTGNLTSYRHSTSQVELALPEDGGLSAACANQPQYPTTV